MNLTQQMWDMMQPEEKLQYLGDGSFEVRKQHGVDGRSKVGAARVITQYQIVMNGVTLAVDLRLSAALRTTANFLESLEPTASTD
jgi:hypothetical protein